MKDYFKSVEKNSAYFNVLAILFLLLPFLVISIYNHPSADDYSYTNFGNRVEFWTAQIDNYYNWTGRYMATALLTVNPIDYTNLTFYRVLPVLLIISFSLSIYIFLKLLLTNTTNKDKGLLGFLIIFLYFYNAPNISEAFYWMPSSVTYQLASILTLLFFSTVIHLLRIRNQRMKYIYTLLGSLLCLSIIGLNETSMIILCVILTSLFLINFYLTKSPNLSLLFLICITIAASVFVIAAPGNLVRMAEKPEKFQLLFSVLGSIKTSLRFIAEWFPMTFFIIVLFSPLLNRIADNLNFRYSFQWLSLLKISVLAFLLFGFIASCFFPAYWSQGGPPPERTVNVICLLFILGTLALAVLFLIYLQTSRRPVPRIPHIGNIFLLLIITGILLFKPNNIRSVYKDLFTGTVYQYHLEMKKRYSLLENCDSRCLVPLIKNRPSTIFAYDLATNPSEEIFYYNKALRHYFELKEIKIKSDELSSTGSAK